MKIRLNKPKIAIFGLLAIAFTSGLYWWKQVKPFIKIENATISASQQTVNAKVSGTISSFKCHPGKKVSKEEAMLTIYHEEVKQELEELEADVQKEKQNLADVKKSLDESMKKYIEANATGNGLLEPALLAIQEAQVEIEAIESKIEKKELNKKSLHFQTESEIVSSIDGIILERLKNEGDFVKRGDPLLVAARPSSFFVSAHVPVTLLQKIKVDLPAIIQFPSYSNQKWNGKIASIGPLVNQEEVEVRIEAEYLPLYPGLKGIAYVRIQ